MEQKFCVFCGGEPTKKDSEHIFPRWMLDLTQSGEVEVGINLHPTRGEKGTRRFFDAYSFKFPACKECNNRYAGFEGRVKKIVEPLSRLEIRLTFADIDLLLDWFDKLRIGLWLAYTYLDDGPQPHMFIDHRIGTKDRVLGILFLDTKVPGFNYSSVQSPVFKGFPCCFFLRIGSVCFVNCSYDFLVTRRVGLPHPAKIVQLGGGPIAYVGAREGSVTDPIFEFPSLDDGMWFAQPIAPPVQFSPVWYERIKIAGFRHSMTLRPEDHKLNPIVFNSKRHTWLSGTTPTVMAPVRRPEFGLWDFMRSLNVHVAERQLKAFREYHQLSILKSKGYWQLRKRLREVEKAQQKLIGLWKAEIDQSRRDGRMGN